MRSDQIRGILDSKKSNGITQLKFWAVVILVGAIGFAVALATGAFN